MEVDGVARYAGAGPERWKSRHARSLSPLTVAKSYPCSHPTHQATRPRAVLVAGIRLWWRSASLSSKTEGSLSNHTDSKGRCKMKFDKRLERLERKVPNPGCPKCRERHVPARAAACSPRS